MVLEVAGDLLGRSILLRLWWWCVVQLCSISFWVRGLTIQTEYHQPGIHVAIKGWLGRLLNSQCYDKASLTSTSFG